MAQTRMTPEETDRFQRCIHHINGTFNRIRGTLDPHRHEALIQAIDNLRGELFGTANMLQIISPEEGERIGTLTETFINSMRQAQNDEEQEAAKRQYINDVNAIRRTCNNTIKWAAICGAIGAIIGAALSLFMHNPTPLVATSTGSAALGGLFSNRFSYEKVKNVIDSATRSMSIRHR